jgi:hypothetical protein
MTASQELSGPRKWLYHIVTERANIELMFNDPYWARLKFATYYPFEVLVFNVTTLVRDFMRANSAIHGTVRIVSPTKRAWK